MANLNRFMGEATDAAAQELHARTNHCLDALDTTEAVIERASADLIAAASVGERVYRDKVRDEALADLYAAWLASAPVVKLIAKPQTKPSKHPCYMVTTEDGEMLVPATDHPLADGSAALLIHKGLPEDTPVALCHEGKGYPSHGPMKLGAAAGYALQRLERRSKAA